MNPRIRVRIRGLGALMFIIAHISKDSSYIQLILLSQFYNISILEGKEEAGKRKELFSAARNEQGDLVICFPHSNITISPSEEFWEGVIDEIEPYLENVDEDGIVSQEEEKIFKEARSTIQDCIKN